MAEASIRTCTVYGLASSEDGQIRYIGQTTGPLRRRLLRHISHAKRPSSKTYRDCWIRKVLRAADLIAVVLLDSAVWNDTERRLIAEYRRNGARLVNATEGGEGCLDCPPELRAKISKTVTERWKDPAFRAVYSNAKAGKPWSAERRDACDAVSAKVRSDRARKGRLSLSPSKRAEASSVAAKALWEKKRAEGAAHGESVNSAKLTEQDVLSIRAMAQVGQSHTEIANKFGVSRKCISKVVHRETWKHIP